LIRRIPCKAMDGGDGGKPKNGHKTRTKGVKEEKRTGKVDDEHNPRANTFSGGAQSSDSAPQCNMNTLEKQAKKEKMEEADMVENEMSCNRPDARVRDYVKEFSSQLPEEFEFNGKVVADMHPKEALTHFLQRLRSLDGREHNPVKKGKDWKYSVVEEDACWHCLLELNSLGMFWDGFQWVPRADTGEIHQASSTVSAKQAENAAAAVALVAHAEDIANFPSTRRELRKKLALEERSKKKAKDRKTKITSNSQQIAVRARQVQQQLLKTKRV